MGLNVRNRGRGSRGDKGLFANQSHRRGGMRGQNIVFRPGPPGMFCNPVRFPMEPMSAPRFPGPPTFNFCPPRYGKFQRRNFKRKYPRNNETPAPEIDLTKPWVTEEIKVEEAKKLEFLETWRKTKDNDDWSKYKLQKEAVKTLYEKAKQAYLSSHPEEDKKVKENSAEGDNKNGST